jgi:hypothetical protein
MFINTYVKHTAIDLGIKYRDKKTEIKDFKRYLNTIWGKDPTVKKH